jgi:hypothetical protein
MLAAVKTLYTISQGRPGRRSKNFSRIRQMLFAAWRQMLRGLVEDLEIFGFQRAIKGRWRRIVP